MLTIKYSDLENQDFVNGVRRLSNTPGQTLDPKTIFDFYKIKKRLDREVKVMQKSFNEIKVEHFELGSKEPKDMAAWEEARGIWEDSTIELKASKIAYGEALRAEMTAGEIIACSNFIEEPRPNLKPVGE